MPLDLTKVFGAPPRARHLRELGLTQALTLGCLRWDVRPYEESRPHGAPWRADQAVKTKGNQNAQEIVRRNSGGRRLAADRGTGGRRRLAVLGLQLRQQTVTNQLSAQRITFPAKAAFAQAKPGTEITPGDDPLPGEVRRTAADHGRPGRGLRQPLHRCPPPEIGKGKTYRS